MRLQEIRPQFVEFIPRQLDEGVLFISERFKTASHLCACGCGTKVVTPFSPAEWQLIQHDKTVSLDPSIGNWNDACQSHYYIRRNRILWAGRMSARQIAFAQGQDRADKERQVDSANEEKMREISRADTHLKPSFPQWTLSAWQAVVRWVRS